MKVVISRPIPGGQEKMLEEAGFKVVVMPETRTQDEFMAEAADADAIISMLSDNLNEENLNKLGSNLKVIANYAVGYNNIDVATCTKKGIAVTNTPDVLTDATADIAMMLILMCMRRAGECETYLRKGNFNGWRAELLLGRDLKGKNLGIYGMGRIGQAVARRAEAFGMNILYNTRSGVKPHLPYPHVSFETLIKESDVLSFHCPLAPETKHLLGKEEIAKMKQDAVVINTARGPVIDEEALADALLSGKLLAAGCDVFEKEPEIHEKLLKCKNAVLLPHIGSGSLETRTDMAFLVVNAVYEGLNGEVPGLVLNPEVKLG
jgi:glyoxylate reductase